MKYQSLTSPYPGANVGHTQKTKIKLFAKTVNDF